MNTRIVVPKRVEAVEKLLSGLLTAREWHGKRPWEARIGPFEALSAKLGQRSGYG